MACDVSPVAMFLFFNSNWILYLDGVGSNPLIDGKTSLQPVFLTTQKAICFLGFIITQLSLYQTLSSKKEEEDRLMLRIGVQ